MTHVCPWWIGYILASPLRSVLGGSPQRQLGPYVKEGMRVLEVGPGMGYFTLPMARMVGERGRVVCVDVQERMLRELDRRVLKAGLAGRVEGRQCSRESLGLEQHAGTFDFCLLAAVVHEIPDQQGLFVQIAHALRPGGTVHLAEPKGHVNHAAFERTIDHAAAAGLRRTAELTVPRCWGALLINR